MTIPERHDTATEVSSERVRMLLAAASAPTEAGPLPGEAEALAVFRAAHPPERKRMQFTPLKAALAAGATAALFVGGTCAAAAAGALPGAAQETAHEVLARIGVTVPGPADASNGHPDQRGASGQDDGQDATFPDDAGSTTDPTEDAGSSDPGNATEGDEGSSGKGAEISELARNTESSGVDKGAEISTQASGGKSQAGQHGAAGDTPSDPAEGAGKPDGVGKPDDAGKPDSPGRPDDAGKPDDPGTPDDTTAEPADSPS